MLGPQTTPAQKLVQVKPFAWVQSRLHLLFEPKAAGVQGFGVQGSLQR
jgi:hypothetical protein